jgi:hypothetical protein
MSSIIPTPAETKEEARRAIRRNVGARYEAERKHGGFWRQLMIRVKIEREVAAELKRRFPPHALFAADSVR